MSTAYGEVSVVDDGQKFTSMENSYKDFYEYNIKHGTLDSEEISKKVFLSGPYQYRITVDKTGYYLLRARVLDEVEIYNADTGVARKLTGYFALKDKKGGLIGNYTFSDFRETIAVEGGSFNGIYIGYEVEDIRRPMRYKVIMYLEKNKVYTGQLSLNSPKNTDKECRLTLCANADMYQYNSTDRNVNTGGLPEYPRMENGIITKVFANEEEIVSYEGKLGNVGAEALHYNRISGLNCCLMWSINESIVRDFSKPLPLTVTNIFYIDQKLGRWLYDELSHINNKERYASVLKDKVKSFTTGAAETAISTGAPILLVEAGIITANVATPVGVIICVLFLFMHAYEKNKDSLDKAIRLLHSYVIEGDNLLNTPIALKFQTQRAIYKEQRQPWDPPGAGPEPQILTASEIEVEAWDGTVIRALGERLQYGEFVFRHYSEFSRDAFMTELKQEVENFE